MSTFRVPVMDVFHYNDVIISAMASQITSLTIVYSTFCSGEDQRKHQSSASLAFVRGIHQWPVNSPHIRHVTRKMFPFDYVIMWSQILSVPAKDLVISGARQPRVWKYGLKYIETTFEPLPFNHIYIYVLIYIVMIWYGTLSLFIFP